jgi:adenine-specific DNA-methyltransferase
MTNDSLDVVRKAVSETIDSEQKARLGQYFTPASVAGFMVSLFTAGRFRECRLLDPGAGIGVLASAFLERCAGGGLRFQHISVDAYEIDKRLLPYLARTLEQSCVACPAERSIHGTDFLAMADAGDLFHARPSPFTHAILNPPYKKIRTFSK